MTDSHYVAGIINRIDITIIGHSNNNDIIDLLLTLTALFNHRRHKVWCTHLKSHTTLPGALVEGNQIIDQAVANPHACTAQMTSMMQEARRSHEFFHQSTRTLQRKFKLPRSQTRVIITAYPNCTWIVPIQEGGVNTQSLQPGQL